jgi:uncharacterized membrane protein
MNGTQFEVIGVFEHDPGLFGGGGVDSFAIIPFSLFRKQNPNSKELIMAFSVRRGGDAEKTKDEVMDAMRRQPMDLADPRLDGVIQACENGLKALLLPRFVAAEKLRAVQWAGLLIAFVGVAVAFAEGFTSGHAGPHQLRGDALALAAGTLWGLTTLVIRSSKMATASAEKTLFYQVAVTAVVAPLISLLLGETWSLTYSAQAWGSIALQTAIGAFASYLAWMWLLRHYPATQMSSFTFLTPVFALVLGVLLLNEPLTLQLMLALCGVAAGIVLVNRRPAR